MAEIKVSMDKMSISAEAGENADYLFAKMANELICGCIGKESTKRIAERIRRPAGEKKEADAGVRQEKELEAAETEEPENKPCSRQENETGLAYGGFIYWKCPDCGEEMGFCLKKKAGGVICRSCGRKHPFTERLKLLYVNCECGSRFKYLTNMDAEMFDMTCINCGSPVAAEWNGKKGIYETVRQGTGE